MPRPHYYSRSPIYFYLIPILIILITFAYTFISYQRDITVSYNKNIRIYNKKTLENNQKGRDIIRDIQLQETAARKGLPLPKQKEAPLTLEEPPTQEKTNLCKLPQIKVKQSSTHQQLQQFGPDKAIDGNSDVSPTSTSISATQAIPGKKSWWMVDLGKDANHLIKQIVMYFPSENHPLGSFSNFRIILVNKDKKIVSENDFHTDNTLASEKETWTLDTPVEARGIRIESREQGRPVIISEVEIYGE